MKKQFVFIVAFLSMIGTLYAQTPKIDLSLKNVPLKVCLSAIEKQCDYTFMYDNSIDVNQKVTIEAKQETLPMILRKVFTQTPIRYEIVGKHIILKLAASTPKSETAEEIRKITGKVTDDKGQALPGVTVVIKGTTKGTITDANGNYMLPNISSNTTLDFSFVGMQSREVNVGNHDVINIALSEVATGLNEVVVVGYGVQKKVTLTGAVSSVQGADIVTTQSQDVSNMLTGKLAGVNVVQTTSEPGTFANSFEIRGFGSPLIVIDGVPRTNMDQIDPNDIASVSVLKDASAAIYGVRAANGVVLITTKQGTNGKLNITYNGSVGLQVPSGMPQSMDAEGYMTFMNQRSEDNFYGGNLMYSAADMQPYINGTKQSTDWYHAVMKNSAPQSQQDISFQGSTNTTNYFVSAGWTTQNGFLQSGSLNYHKYNVRSNITSNITKRLKVSLNISAIMDQKNQPYQSSWWIIRSIWRQIPIESSYSNNTPGYYQ
jgi:TonB-linked SusC/RagA family outer membrane protein